MSVEGNPDVELSIVVPVYREERNIPEFTRRLRPILDSITPRHEIIFAMDPSPDGTEEAILQQRRDDPRIKLIKFSRRFGQPMSTLAGMQFSAGNAVIVMDVDLQDPPELINEMVARWREGFEVVYAQRRSRHGETFAKRFISWVGYRLINRIAEVQIPPNAGDFRLMSRRVVQEVLRLKECHGFLRGLVALVGFRQTSVMFDRPERFAGQGHYNRFIGSLRIGLNGVICFSSYLLSLTSTIGFLIAGISFLLGIVCAIMKILGFPFPIGTATVIILILFMSGIQLIGVGVLGEYIARIYDEVKQRPKFIVDRAVGFKDSSEQK